MMLNINDEVIISDPIIGFYQFKDALGKIIGFATAGTPIVHLFDANMRAKTVGMMGSNLRANPITGKEDAILFYDIEMSLMDCKVIE